MCRYAYLPMALICLAGAVLARPPRPAGSGGHSSRSRGYYGSYNDCKLQIMPWPSEVRCDSTTARSARLHQIFSVQLTDSSKSRDSVVLREGMARYSDLILNHHPLHISRGLLVEPQFILEGDDDDYGYSSSSGVGTGLLPAATVDSLLIEVLSDHAGSPAKQLDDDESYTLEIKRGEDGKLSAVATAQTVWGALYAMETFSQLVEWGGELRAVPLFIADAPRFPWRGLLLDTSNHYISISIIAKFLDAMAAVKLNVLHWHLVDSYSFPFKSEIFPGLAESGAWLYEEGNGAKNAVYDAADLERVESLARERGIRVVIEMDMPGHGFSWGMNEDFKEITTSCPRYTDELGHIDDIPLDPTLSKTYDVVSQLMKEIVGIFPDMYLHVGGDEVKYGCWNESQAILDWMEQNGFEPGDFYSLEQMFFSKIHSLATGEWRRKLVAWEEVFFDSSGGSDGSHGSWIGSEALPPQSTVVESWTGPSYLNTARIHGYDGILAYGWYLDRQNPVDGQHAWFFGDTWAQMYSVDPESPSSADESTKALLDEQKQQLEEYAAKGIRVGRALGGEASIWTEQADDQNIESQVWPRAGAVAERLWSPRDIVDPAAAAPRLSAMRCLLVSRFALRAGPIWSDYCSASVAGY